MTATTNRFLKQIEKPIVAAPEAVPEKKPNRFLSQIKQPKPQEEEEDAISSNFRTAIQPIIGYLAGSKPAIATAFWQLLGLGESLDPEEIEHIEKISEREGIPFDREKYLQAVAAASKTIPTVPNLVELIEEKTGIPLVPETKLQKGLNLAGMAFKGTPGALGQKITASLLAPTGSALLQKAGVPEPIADIVGLGGGGIAAQKVPPVSIGKATKPSGLTTRQFEKVTKPTKISAGKHAKINEALEGDFKAISEDLLQSHPTYNEIKSDPLYAQKLSEGFEKVEDLAKQMPETIKKRQLTSFMDRRLKTHHREMKGITPSEAEETFRKDYGDLIKKVSDGPEQFNVADSVAQVRKNNQELAEYFEPGRSKGFNKGKRDALMEYNKAIEELYETVYPDSEFTNIFKEQNRLWSNLKDVETIEDQFSKIFQPDKIKFNEAKKILNKNYENLRRPFKRIMGKEGFQDFENLLEDFISVENPYSLLKKATDAGFGDLAKLGASYLIHPKLAKLSGLTKLPGMLMRSLLDKPQLSIIWKDAISDLKAGRYATAQMGFEEIDKEAKSLSERVSEVGQKKGKMLPPGYSPEIEEKITEINPNIYANPDILTKEQIKLNEPNTYYTSKLFESNLSSGEKKLIKNSWNKLLDPRALDFYYSPKEGTEIIGYAGNLILDPKIKKLYKDVSKIPVIRKNLKEGVGGLYDIANQIIYIAPHRSPQDFYQALIHELHHAYQDNKGFKFIKPRTRTQYWTSRQETKARLAQRYATKNIQRNRGEILKIRKYAKEKYETSK